jgi:hypothetical protein
MAPVKRNLSDQLMNQPFLRASALFVGAFLAATTARAQSGAGLSATNSKSVESPRKSFDTQHRVIEQEEKSIQTHPGGPSLQNFSGGGAGGKRSGSIGGTGGNTTVSGGNVLLKAGPDATVRRAQGKTTLTWKGQTIDLGPTTGRLSFRNHNANGVESSTLLENDRVLWDSQSGLAKPAR